MPNLGINISTNHAKFISNLDAAKESSRYGAAVDSKTEEQLKGATTIVDNNGSVGAAVMPDGDIVAVFKNKQTNNSRNAGRRVAIDAVAAGGIKLDCYGAFLANTYAYAGMEPVARVNYKYGENPEYDVIVEEDLASGKISKEPYIYFMKLVDGYDISKAAEYAENVRIYSQNELDELPLMDYDSAWEYRDGLLKNGANQPTGLEILEQYAAQKKKSGPNLEPLERYAEEQAKRKRDNPFYIANESLELPTLKPKATQKDGNNQSNLYDSLLTSDIVDDTFKKMVEGNKNIEKYESVSNASTLEQAADNLDKGGESFVRAFTEKLGKSIPSNTDVATAVLLMDRYQEIGDYEGMITIAEKLRSAGTEAGRAVQMFSILGRMTPEGMVEYAKRSLKLAGERLIEKRSAEWQKAHENDFKLTDDDIKFIIEQTKLAASLPEGRDKNIALAKISARINDKLPTERGQKARALARISMLFNPKTQLRNFLGNAVMIPWNTLADVVGSGIDKAIAKKTGVRTTGVANLKETGQNYKAAWQGLKEAAEDFRLGIDTRDVNADRFEISKSTKSFSSKTVIGRALNGLDRITSLMLDAGDRPFFKAAYVNSLNTQMRLNKVDTPTKDMIDIATAEALQRTWQDDNQYVKLSQGAKKALNRINVGGYGLGDVFIKFTKTPANLTKAVVDFSPVGLLTSIAKDGKALKTAMDNGTVTPQIQKQFVNSVSKGITGTLLSGLFAVLAQAGIISGAGDEDKDVANFEKNVLGIMPYSVKIGDTSLSYEWISPIGTNAAIVADMYKTMKEDSDANVASAAWNAIKTGGQVLFNQSFMQSIQNLFGYDGFVQGALNSVLSEPTAFVPQLLSQIAQMFDDNARTTYVKGNPLKTALNKVLYKIPGLRNTLPETVDVLGREIESKHDIFNVFFNPANNVTANPTRASEEMYSVYKATGDNGVIPPLAPYNVTVNGEKVNFTPEQRNEYQKIVGDIATDGVDALISTAAYKGMSDEEKAEAVKDVYTCAVAMAKSELTDYALPDKYANIQSYVDDGTLGDYFYANAEFSNMSGEGSTDAKRDLLMSMDLTPEQKKRIDEDLISKGDTKVDYTSDESFVISQMSESAQYKWKAASAWGLSYNQYKTYYDVFYSGNNTRKDVGLQNLVNAGMTSAQANYFYNKVLKSSASGGKETDNKKNAALKWGLSENQYETYWKAYSTYGTKTEKIQALMNVDMSEAQAKYFYNLMQKN